MAIENGTENGAASANKAESTGLDFTQEVIMDDRTEELQNEINKTHDALNQVDSLLIAGIATLERSDWQTSEELGALLYLLQMTRRKVVDIVDPPIPESKKDAA